MIVLCGKLRYFLKKKDLRKKKLRRKKNLPLQIKDKCMLISMFKTAPFYLQN